MPFERGRSRGPALGVWKEERRAGGQADAECCRLRGETPPRIGCCPRPSLNPSRSQRDDCVFKANIDSALGGKGSWGGEGDKTWQGMKVGGGPLKG